MVNATATPEAFEYFQIDAFGKACVRNITLSNYSNSKLKSF